MQCLDRRKRLLGRLLLGVLAAISIVVAPAIAFGATAAPPATATGTSAGSIGIRLLDVPVREANDPRARLYIVDHVAPGTAIERQVEVVNSTSSNLPVAIYAAGATIENGSFIGAAARAANDLSSWTSVSPAAPQIPAGGTAKATVTIAVPADATSGEQYAVVWVEARTPADAAGVTEVNRVGIRIYLSVGAGLAPVDSFTIDSLTAERSKHGNPVVVAAVHNTGGPALDMSGTLQLLAGPGGLSAGPFPAALGVTVAIGATEAVRITLNAVVPMGPWLARVTLHSGLTERSAKATITFPASGTSAPVNAVQSHRRSHAVTAGIAVVIVLAITAAATAFSFRALARRRPRAAVGSSVVERGFAPGRNLARLGEPVGPRRGRPPRGGGPRR